MWFSVEKQNKQKIADLVYSVCSGLSVQLFCSNYSHSSAVLHIVRIHRYFIFDLTTNLNVAGGIRHYGKKERQGLTLLLVTLTVSV